MCFHSLTLRGWVGVHTCILGLLYSWMDSAVRIAPLGQPLELVVLIVKIPPRWHRPTTTEYVLEVRNHEGNMPGAAGGFMRCHGRAGSYHCLRGATLARRTSRSRRRAGARVAGRPAPPEYYYPYPKVPTISFCCSLSSCVVSVPLHAPTTYVLSG